MDVAERWSAGHTSMDVFFSISMPEQSVLVIVHICRQFPCPFPSLLMLLWGNKRFQRSLWGLLQVPTWFGRLHVVRILPIIALLNSRTKLAVSFFHCFYNITTKYKITVSVYRPFLTTHNEQHHKK